MPGLICGFFGLEEDNSLTGAVIGAVVLLAVNAGVVRIIHRFDCTVRLFRGQQPPWSRTARSTYLDGSSEPGRCWTDVISMNHNVRK